MDKINIRDLSPGEIEDFIAHLGKEKYRARQLMKWLYRFNVASFGEMTTPVSYTHLTLPTIYSV